MAWFLALQGPPSKIGQSPTYELHESADIERITEEMANSVADDRVVAIPAVFANNRRQVTVYVRPASWGAWAFYQMTEEERRELIASNPLITALAQAQAGKQQGAPRRPATGPSVIPRLE